MLARANAEQIALAILAASPAALLLAISQHVYVRVHYRCTERPDMLRIHGKA